MRAPLSYRAPAHVIRMAAYTALAESRRAQTEFGKRFDRVYSESTEGRAVYNASLQLMNSCFFTEHMAWFHTVPTAVPWAVLHQ